MSHIEGDGVIEDIYYLLWRKDSPFKERLNIQIPDTVIFRKGRPIAWYFTNKEGAVLRKKQTSLVYEEIVSKFTRKTKEGEIVAYFININEEKKLERLLDKTYFEGHTKAEAKEEEEVPPCHDVEYFGLKEFKHTFSDFKHFENKTGILQRFIQPYGSNNELIQAIWSPRVCVFTKRVNLRRLNETRFDVYERALTFDGPDFYSKNVPLRGGYIPGKLRATCDNIVQHIAYISYEKISIKRLVGYFKVDKDENVWFLWTSSIRINETSLVHKRLSKFVDKPLCLEPCMQTSVNIRHIKTNFASRPVTLQMNEECTVCCKKVSQIAFIPVIYRLLLGNEEILKRSEHSASQARLMRPKKNFDDDDFKPRTIRKASIGVPYFIKKLHPDMKLKEFQNLRDQEHFLMMRADVCEECYLIVSKEYEGGFPYNLTEAKKHSLLNTSDSTAKDEFSRAPGTVRTNEILNSSNKKKQALDDDDSNCEEDTIRESSPKNRGDVSAADFVSLDVSTNKAPALKGTKAKLYNLLPKPIYTGDEVMDVSKTTTSNKSSFPRFMNRTVWAQTTKSFHNPSRFTGDSYMEETKFDSFQFDHSSLKRDVVKAMIGDSETSMNSRNLYSANRSQNNATVLAKASSGGKIPVNSKPRPQTSLVKQKSPKQGRRLIIQGNGDQVPHKYQLDEVPDLFDDSNQESEELENIMNSKIADKDAETKKLRPGKGTSKVQDLKALVAANSVKHTSFNARTTESRENKGRGYLVDLNQELNTENRLQDHLDQDIVLMMENDAQKKQDRGLLLNNYQMPRKDNNSAASSSFSNRLDTQGSTNHPNPHSKLGLSTLRSQSGKSTKLKFNQQNAFNEKNIVKELEDKIEDIIGKYYEDDF